MVREFETNPNEADRAAFFFAGIEGADMQQLARLSHRKPLPLRTMNLRKLIRWVAQSLQVISRSMVGDQVELPPPDWMKL